VKPARYLYPLSLIYGVAAWLRNFLFDKNIISSKSAGIPVICIGNLSVGGTGKTPMVAYTVQRLKSLGFHPAVITRGYKRRSRSGFIIEPSHSVEETGDEPLMLFRKLQTPVAIGKDRLESIRRICYHFPKTDVIVMDDGYQYRRIRPSLSILLTASNNPFTNDNLLPAGNLRESRKEAVRAQAVIVTKMPDDHVLKQNELISKIKKYSSSPILFSSLGYSFPVPVFSNPFPALGPESVSVLAFSGIADDSFFVQNCNRMFSTVTRLSYPDHHSYSVDDLKTIIKSFDAIASEPKILLTTEKDMVKLQNFDELKKLPLFYLPVEPCFNQEDELLFTKLITTYVKRNK